MLKLILVLAVLLIGLPSAIHMAHDISARAALRMALDDYRAVASCPGRIGDTWALLQRRDPGTTGQDLVKAFCEDGRWTAEAPVEREGPNGTVNPGNGHVAPPTPSPTPAIEQDADLDELRAYALELINGDRAQHGLAAVTLARNSAAQRHAEDMLEHSYVSHWDRDGLKPYMRYTLAGGRGHEAENVAGPVEPRRSDVRYREADAMTLVKEAHQGLMDSPGHRRNILDPAHQMVNLGISCDRAICAVVQQFEHRWGVIHDGTGLEGTRLTVHGSLDAAVGPLRTVALFYDPPPRPMTREELNAGPPSYGLGDGEPAITVLAPPPPGFSYTDLPDHVVIAEVWRTRGDGFTVQAELGDLASSPGVYTVALFAEDAAHPLTTSSLFTE